MYRRTPEESAAIIAYGFVPGRLSPGVFDSVIATHERPTLELAARLIRARLAAVETEISRRP